VTTDAERDAIDEHKQNVPEPKKIDMTEDLIDSWLMNAEIVLKEDVGEVLMEGKYLCDHETFIALATIGALSVSRWRPEMDNFAKCRQIVRDRVRKIIEEGK
jgi:hypothetical protein